jgi:alkanesulfonate monooxygenase SsuD/methylene tetrahydromethanopterin reductase-like flavin-dependent oxidoreductase (luciferase family)
MPIGLRPPSLLQPPEMAAKIAQLHRLLHQAGRPVETVTISFTAPIAFATVSGTSRPLLSGRPEEIAADLRQYQALGVGNFNLNLPGASISAQQEAMEQFAREVLPLVPRT